MEILETRQLPCLPKSMNPHRSECWFAGLGQTENETKSSGFKSMTVNSMNRDYCINKNHR